jgi:hypothetical protein
MSTSNINPAPETPQTPEAPHDEYTGAFGFFRKYQKLILYTAVMFALATFSITGAMQQWFTDVFSGSSKVSAAVKVQGAEASLTPEDYRWASQLAQNWRAVTNVLPPLGETSNSSDLLRRYAALRRASIAEGLDVSMAEVDKAIESYTAMVNTRMQNGGKVTPAQLARMQGMDSLAQYREIVREAMRIGNYVRLNSIGVDGTDAALMASILDGQEKITLRTAQFDMKALEEELKKKGDVKEEDFKKWLEGKPENDKTQMGVYDTNLVSLVLGIGRMEGFDPAQWADELKEFKFGDEQLKQLYEEEKENRFKLEKPVDGQKWKAMDDQAVKDELTKLAKLEEVLNVLRTKVAAQLEETLKPLQETLTKDSAEKAQAEALRGEARLAADAKPDDAALKQQVTEADNILAAKTNAEKASREALEAARKNFDFGAKFAEWTKGKTGFDVQELKGPKNADDLKDLAAAPYLLGEWKLPQLATNIATVGEIGAKPARTAKGAFLFRTTEVVVRPMKAWDKVKTVVEEKYFIEVAKKTADEKKKIFDEKLLELGKGKIADKIKEIEAKRQGEIDKRYAAWEKETTDKLAEADKNLAKLGGASLAAKQAWQSTRDRIDAELKGKDAKKKSFEGIVALELENEIKAEAKKKYGEVLEDAAKAAGFAVTSLGPIWREASSKVPGFARQSDKAVVYLWSGVGRNLKVTEATDIVEDMGNRRYLMASCEKVEPLQANDVPRKEFALQQRNYQYQGLSFAEHQVRKAIEQSYTMDGIKARYHFKEDGRDDAPTDGKPADSKPADGKSK